jgi:hypothetical protein
VSCMRCRTARQRSQKRGICHQDFTLGPCRGVSLICVWLCTGATYKPYPLLLLSGQATTSGCHQRRICRMREISFNTLQLLQPNSDWFPFDEAMVRSRRITCLITKPRTSSSRLPDIYLPAFQQISTSGSLCRAKIIPSVTLQQYKTLHFAHHCAFHVICQQCYG